MKSFTINDLKNNLQNQNTSILISWDILEAYFKYRISNHYKNTNERILKSFLKYSNNQISIPIINKFIDSLKINNNSKILYMSNLKTFLNWINDNLNLDFKVNLLNKYTSDPSRRQALTRKELQQVIELLDDFNRPKFKIAFLLLATNGIRVGELCSINWSEIEGETYQIKSKKTGKIRTIWINSEIRELLNCFGFDLTYKTILEYFTLFKKFVKKRLPNFNKNISSHVLRHTVATLAIENGISVETVAQMLGHQNINTTFKVYIHGNKNLEVQNFKLLQLKPVDIFNNRLLVNENRLLRKLLITSGIDLNKINNYIDYAEELEIKKES